MVGLFNVSNQDQNKMSKSQRTFAVDPTVPDGTSPWSVPAGNWNSECGVRKPWRNPGFGAKEFLGRPVKTAEEILA